MANTCRTCSHPKVMEINERIAQWPARRESWRALAAHYGLSVSGLRRHLQACLPWQIAAASEAAEMLSADNLLGKLAESDRRMEQLERAIHAALLGADGEMRLTPENMPMLRELSRAITTLNKGRELFGRIAGLIENRTTLTVQADPALALFLSALSDRLGASRWGERRIRQTEALVEEAMDATEKVLREKAGQPALIGTGPGRNGRGSHDDAGIAGD